MCVQAALLYAFLCSGSSTSALLYKLLATILILKLLACRFPEQFPLRFTPKIAIAGKVDRQYEARVRKAIEFAVRADRLQPSLYARLELGYSWEATAEELLLDPRLKA